jgi:protein fantom
MSTNIRAANESLQAMDEEAARRPPDNVNELHIKITRCSGLKARRDSKMSILILVNLRFSKC